MRTVAIVPAAGRGERMGADKALLDLGGTTAIERIVVAPAARRASTKCWSCAATARPLPAARGAHRAVPAAARWPTACARRAALPA
jgi:CTP:molybdopterin cytidylyltransferase MocA